MSVIFYKAATQIRSQTMSDNYIECPELSGRTIQMVRIYKDTGYGTELQIDFIDGTSFSCSVSHPPTVQAALYMGGTGSPINIKNYDV